MRKLIKRFIKPIIEEILNEKERENDISKLIQNPKFLDALKEHCLTSLHN